jgi:hypothetical protein
MDNQIADANLLVNTNLLIGARVAAHSVVLSDFPSGTAVTLGIA